MCFITSGQTFSVGSEGFLDSRGNRVITCTQAEGFGFGEDKKKSLRIGRLSVVAVGVRAMQRMREQST